MKIRIRYTKNGKVRFTSHRDVARLFERAFRKLRLPISYTEGFSPRPKLSFGLALTVAHESDAEYLDVDLATSVDLEELPGQLSAVLPEGLDVSATVVLEPGSISLQQAIVGCSWEIEVIGLPIDEVAGAVASVLDAPVIPLERVRKGKTAVVDVRPAILELEVVGPTDRGVQLEALLATEAVSLRPAELVQVVGAGLGEGRVRRTHQWTSVEPERSEPIGLPLVATGHPQRRAS
jgi:radical SAM-linked protein